MEPLEWPHCLAMIDMSCLNHGVKFYDEDGYDIVPIYMVQVMHEIEPKIEKKKNHDLSLADEVSIQGIFELDQETKNGYDLGDDLDLSEKEDFDVHELEIEKVRMLLKNQEDV